MTAHSCERITEGCYRCELNLDEAGIKARACWKKAEHDSHTWISQRKFTHWCKGVKPPETVPCNLKGKHDAHVWVAFRKEHLYCEGIPEERKCEKHPEGRWKTEKHHTFCMECRNEYKRLWARQQGSRQFTPEQLVQKRAAERRRYAEKKERERVERETDFLFQQMYGGEE